MNKPSLFLALAAFAAIASCSEDKELTRNDHCLKTPPSKECFIGSWTFEGVWENSNTPSRDCSGGDSSDGDSLRLKKEGGFEFTGGVYERDCIGTWSIEGNVITIEDFGLNKDDKDKSGTVVIKASGNNIEIIPIGDRTVFSDAGGCGGEQIEKFKWKGP